MPSPSRRELRWLAVALLAVALASAPALANGFVWDDLTVIVRGDVIHDARHLEDVFTHRTLYVAAGFEADDVEVGVDTYRPLTLATFFVDSAIGGRSPLPYHLTNLLAHLGCVVLVFLLARRLLRPERRHLAALAATWFGLSPHLAEAHVWINGRSDVFVTLFCIGALLVHRRGAAAAGRRRLGLFVLSGALFFASLLCKEVALLALPAFALFPREAEVEADFASARERLVGIIPHTVAAGAYLAIRGAVLSGMRTHRDPEQLLAAAVRAPVMLLDGFAELMVPTRVYIHSMRDDYRALGLTAVIALGAVALLLLILVFSKRRALPSLAWSVFFFVCTFAPAAVIATMLWPGFGRYLYLPFAGLVGGLTSALAHGYDRLVERRPGATRIVRFAIGGYLAILGLRLAVFATDFHDERTLWAATMVAASDRAHGHGWYGATLLEEGEPEAAIEPLHRAATLDPSEPRYLSQLVHAHLQAGNRQGALDAAATGIARYSPHAGEFHALAAHALADIRPDLAQHHVETCLTDEPGRPECLEVRALLGSR